MCLQKPELRIYEDQNELYRFSLASPVAAVAFGKYGMEDNVLAIVFKDGSLDIKVRSA